jgi:His-Xaa-Ser system radical SAM maturase HxsB
MTSLAPTFHGQEAYAAKGYSLLPFRFMRLADDRYIATNLAGDYVCLPRKELTGFVQRTLHEDDPLLADLEARHFLRRAENKAPLELLAAQYRTKQSRLPWLTGLHLFVVTLRCDHSCQYCQVSRATNAAPGFDMSPQTADRAVDIMLQSPSPVLKVEFQGGEPLLNFPIVQRIVERTCERTAGREVQFVVATNLSQIDDLKLEFLAKYRFQISTSLDGPSALHNQNRPRPGRDAYERTVAGIRRCRERLGPDTVSALLTCTAESLPQPEAIVDEYVAQGFPSIFLRHISPYGFAARSQQRLGYETEQFLQFYRRGLARILWHNRQGRPLREVYASILLGRILSSAPATYVDLQSPAGLGLACLAYNYDGDVYASDEGRMLAEMGDKSFRLGNVHQHRWRDLFLDGELLEIAHATMTEGLPGCADCAFQPYCGSDPVFHHATQGDHMGHRPSSAFCRRNMEIIRHLILLLEDDSDSGQILRRWAA